MRPRDPDISLPELDAAPTSNFTISPSSVGRQDVLAGIHEFEVASPVGSLGLNQKERLELRRVILRTAFVGVKHEPDVHYTEDSRRWSGISYGMKSWRGQYPPYADCSSYVTWAYWDAREWLGLPDFLNGAGWLAGYTGTMVHQGVRVDPDALLAGDLVFYGDLWLPYHVALYIGGGRVISHGREQGPEIVNIGPASQFRRYVL